VLPSHGRSRWFKSNSAHHLQSLFQLFKKPVL
ncbi:uncharacterized protein METZ01_LOCUS394806, partial [marine metagenome]